MNLSIILINYNDASLLRERIRSLHKELDTHDELVIVDDASTDNSRDIITYFTNNYLNIRKVFRSINGGVAQAICTGVFAARNEYLFLASVDDLCLEGSLRSNFQIVKQFPGITICSGDYSFTTDRNNLKESYHISAAPSLNQPTHLNPKEIVSFSKYEGFWIPGHTAIIKKSILQEIIPKTLDLGPYIDYFFVHAIALKYGCLYIPSNGIVFVEHPDSYSRKTNTLQFKQAFLQKLNNAEFKHVKSLFYQSHLLYRIIENCTCFFLLFKESPKHLLTFLPRLFLKDIKGLIEKLTKKKFLIHKSNRISKTVIP